jgi:nitrite reductase/ring-hydroxylating ferredoxin subunit
MIGGNWRARHARCAHWGVNFQLLSRSVYSIMWSGPYSQRSHRGELLEPLHHSAIAANTGQTTEPREQRIAGDVAQVLAPPRLEHSNAITSSTKWAQP